MPSEGESTVTLLFSVRPDHASRIMDGTKRYEFRKARCRRKADRVLIYSTRPVGRVVGEARIKGVVEGDPEAVWAITCDAAGISKGFFDEYYRGRDRAVAYELEDVVRYVPAKELSEIGVSRAPQSFMYLDRRAGDAGDRVALATSQSLDNHTARTTPRKPRTNRIRRHRYFVPPKSSTAAWPR